MHTYEITIGDMIEGKGTHKGSIQFTCLPTAEALLVELHARVPFTIVRNDASLTDLQCWLNEIAITPEDENVSTLLIGTGPQGFICDHRYDIHRAHHEYADLNYVGSV